MYISASDALVIKKFWKFEVISHPSLSIFVIGNFNCGNWNQVIR
jgi:hypothetical protein